MGTLSMVAAAVDGKLTGSDREFTAVNTDTRSLQPGELFVALRGERFDAAEFVDQAERLGAAGAVVARRQDVDLPQVEVDDTLNALGRLAADWRDRFMLPVIGITGSSGKTTVKEMIAAILCRQFGDADRVLATAGNLNNEIGLPLTVLRLRDRHSAAVIEMGASRRNDIAYLAGIAKPTAGIVTNAGTAHLEIFGSKQAIAETKGELFGVLGEGQLAVINRDDRYFDLWCELAAPARIVSFGLQADADYSAAGISESITADGFELSFDVREANDLEEIRLPMAGRHNVLNALGAIAVTRAVGASWDSIRAGLALTSGVTGRLRTMRGQTGERIIDDSYNANPASVAAAIDVLAGIDGTTWLVLGDMAELGAQSRELHAEIGQRASAAGIERLFALGPDSAAAVAAFGHTAFAGSDHAAVITALRDALAETNGASLTILVKGSRCMQMEKVVQALVTNAADMEETA